VHSSESDMIIAHYVISLSTYGLLQPEVFYSLKTFETRSIICIAVCEEELRYRPLGLNVKFMSFVTCTCSYLCQHDRCEVLTPEMCSSIPMCLSFLFILSVYCYHVKIVVDVQ
jgi:hypothetical protein